MKKKFLITIFIFFTTLLFVPTIINAKEQEETNIGTAIRMNEDGSIWEDGKFIGYYTEDINYNIGTAIRMNEDGSIWEDGKFIGYYTEDINHNIGTAIMIDENGNIWEDGILIENSELLPSTP